MSEKGLENNANRENNGYVEESIANLSSIDHVRHRVEMYLGTSTTPEALHNWLDIALDYSIEEALHKRCQNIRVNLKDDYEVHIASDDLGLPVTTTYYPKFLAIILTATFTGARVGWLTGGFHGTGLPAFTALSEWLNVETKTKGYVWQQRFEQGYPTHDQKLVRPLKAGETTGTRFHAKPDFSVLQRFAFDFERIAQRCYEAAITIPGLKIILKDERVKPALEKHYHFPAGIKAMVSDLNNGRVPLHPIIYALSEVPYNDLYHYETPVRLEFAAQLVADQEITIRSYCNSVQVTHGGTHLTGFQSAFIDTLKQFSKTQVEQLPGGLTGVLNLYYSDPHYSSMNEIRLLNPELEQIVYRIVQDTLLDTKDQWLPAVTKKLGK